MTLPNLTREQVLALPGVADLAAAGPVIVGVRGFFDQPDHNQRGVYDDAAFILGPAPEDFKAFNWNTDPTVTKPGMAVLQPGTYEWTKGLHGIHHYNDIVKGRVDGAAIVAKIKAFYETNLAKGIDYPEEVKDRDGKHIIIPYPAFRQAAPFTVLRDGKTTPETVVDPSGWPWIDGHHGGAGTSSEGCQTVPLEQWHDFRAFGYGLMDKYNATKIKYHLIIKA